MSGVNESRPTALPTDAAARKAIPMARGLLDYFPAALAEVARLSARGNDQHNPGEELHWSRGKSADHADCVLRHLIDRGSVDTDGVRHSAKAAWRALALLQLELEAAGAPVARGAQGASSPSRAGGECASEAISPCRGGERTPSSSSAGGECATCAGLRMPGCPCRGGERYTPANTPSSEPWTTAEERTCATCYHAGCHWPCSACSLGPDSTGTDMWQSEEEG
jgi:hypothetical protein